MEELFGLAEIFADSGKKGIGALHLLQKEQFPGIASNQPGADLQILDVAYLGEFIRQILECFWIFWKDG